MIDYLIDVAALACAWWIGTCFGAREERKQIRVAINWAATQALSTEERHAFNRVLEIIKGRLR